MNIFDLDDAATWAEQYEQFLSDDPLMEKVNEAINNKDSDFCADVLRQLGNGEEHSDVDYINKAKRRCIDYLGKSYTHVTAYHGCRPSNISSYKASGIQPLDPAVMIRKARDMFGASDKLDMAVETLRNQGYIKHGEGTVGFFMSKEGLLQNDDYCNYGSELLYKIAVQLGDWAVKMLTDKGKPMILRCALPIEWLDMHCQFSPKQRYAIYPCMQIVSKLCAPNEDGYTIVDGFLMKRQLPPELLIID